MTNPTAHEDLAFWNGGMCTDRTQKQRAITRVCGTQGKGKVRTQ